MSKTLEALKNDPRVIIESSNLQEVTIPEVRIAAVPATVDGGAWGASEIIDSNDLLVGKILHQQALSKFVQDGKATAGDWCDSLTGEVIAKRDADLSLIIFHSTKKLLISKGYSGDKIEFVEAQEVTPANANLPWKQEMPNGEIVHRHLQYNYFCMLPDKINELPYVISFSSSKIKTAKKLNTMIAKLARIQRPSAGVVFKFKSIKETGEKGSWFGVEISQGRDTTLEELKIAHDWYVQIKTNIDVKVAESSSDVDDMPF